MDIASFVLGQASAGGGGSSPTGTINITQNGNNIDVADYAAANVNVQPTLQTKTATPTTSAQDVEPDSGYLLSKVTVDAIPSQYIVPAGKKTITENGTDIDVSQFATADVAVPSSGGSSWTKVYSGEVTDNYSGTTGAALTTINLGDLQITEQQLLVVIVKDKAGLSDGKYFGSVCFVFPKISNVNWLCSAGCCYRGSGSSQDGSLIYSTGSNAYGIYPTEFLASTNTLSLSHKYSGTKTGTIDGTYTIEVYLLDYAPNGNPFS